MREKSTSECIIDLSDGYSWLQIQLFGLNSLEFTDIYVALRLAVIQLIRVNASFNVVLRHITRKSLSDGNVSRSDQLNS